MSCYNSEDMIYHAKVALKGIIKNIREMSMVYCNKFNSPILFILSPVLYPSLT